MSMRLSGVSPEVQEHVAIVIESAANYIVENGWHKGSFNHGNDPTACAATAILIAAGYISRPYQVSEIEEEWEKINEDLAVVAFADYLRMTFDNLDPTRSNTATIWSWNDFHAESEDEVLTALMSASGSLRQGARVAA